MLIGLIRKVTGVTISAFFKDQTGYKYSGREMEMPWHNRSGFGHNIRKYRMRSAKTVVSLGYAWALLLLHASYTKFCIWDMLSMSMARCQMHDHLCCRVHSLMRCATAHYALWAALANVVNMQVVVLPH